jgi:ABC-2 type transport system permease protein
LLMMPTVNGLEADTAKGFKVIPWFSTQSDSCWSEPGTTNFIDDTPKFDPAKGEIKKEYTTIAGLDRKVGGKEQKILISGDADWLSTGELNMSHNGIVPANYYLIDGVFFWLSDGKAPIDTRRPDHIDKSLRIGKNGWAFLSPLFKWVFPAILILAGLVIWIRRKGR